MTADGTNTQEVHQWGQDADLNVWVPHGARVVNVKCGGWPVKCTSELYMVRSEAYMLRIAD